MDEPVDIWCGPNTLPRRFRTRGTISLDSTPGSDNVHIKIEKITKKLAQKLPPITLDLIEIASYVYAGDQIVPRGGRTLPGDGKDWRREFVYHIPVRCLEVWQNTETKELLRLALGFLSDDYYEFNFRQLTRTVNTTEYFKFDEGKPWFAADKVILFSGGLDSLAGLCETIRDTNDNVILVSHRPAPQTDTLQKALLKDFKDLTKTDNRLMHVRALINKSEQLTKDTHQRTRSFLYASLAASMAYVHDLSKAYFYENGITSSNLPIGPSVLGARASRTTHPRSLQKLSALISMVFDKEFRFENPFFWKTKADIVKTILDCGAKDLIRHTCSCSHVRTTTPLSNHCGVCSQCVGRRLAIMANAAEADDPEEMYWIRLPKDPIPKDNERAMVELIIKAGRDFETVDMYDFFSRYSPALAIVESLGMDSNEAAKRLLELHQRHGQQVCQTLQAIVEKNADLVGHGTVPSNSMLSMIIGVPGERRKIPSTSKAIPLPEDAKWEDITIEIVGLDAAKIIVNGQCHVRTAAEIGFFDRTRKSPGRLWDLLVDFAEADGTLGWKTKGRSHEWKNKDFQRLRIVLKKFFGLRDDPFLPYEKKEGYKTRFHTLYDRTVNIEYRNFDASRRSPSKNS